MISGAASPGSGRDGRRTALRRHDRWCTGTHAAAGPIPGRSLSCPTLGSSEGPRPANSRHANPTREYQNGSGARHDPALVHHPHPARPPPGGSVGLPHPAPQDRSSSLRCGRSVLTRRTGTPYPKSVRTRKKMVPEQPEPDTGGCKSLTDRFISDVYRHQRRHAALRGFGLDQEAVAAPAGPCASTGRHSRSNGRSPAPASKRACIGNPSSASVDHPFRRSDWGLDAV
jgi:hypothetical protein